MTQHRYSFNAGEIAPELAWRCDLAKYPNACVTLENMLVTPWGGAARRPAWEVRWQGVLTNYLSAPCRLFPFLGAGDSLYLILLAVASGNPECMVYPAEGDGGLTSAVELDFTSELGWMYAATDLYTIQFVQSFDVFFLCHPNYPVVRIERHAHDDWRVREHAFLGGPFRAENTDPGSILTPVVPEWDAGTEYGPGEVVVVGDGAVALSGAVTWVFWYYTYATWNDSTGFTPDRAYYRAVLPTATAHAFEVGDTVTVSGTTHYDGQWEVLATSANSITVNVGTIFSGGVWTNHWAETFGPGTSVKREGASGFWEAIATGTNKPPATEPTYWRATPVYRGELELEATAEVFSEGMVGGKIRLNHPRKTHFYQANSNAPSPATDEHMATFTAAGTASAGIPVFGSVTLTTAEGRWGGTLELQKSLNAGATWETIGAINSGNADYNGTISRDIEELGAVVRVYMREYKAPSTSPTGCMWRLEVTSYSDAAILTITDYTDARHVTCTTDNYLYSREGTHKWEEGLFSAKNGYPAAIAIHEERLMVAGVPAEPFTVCGSKVNEWQTFMRGTLETSPIQFALAANTVERIQWLASRQNLHIGTDLGEWTLGSRDSDRILSGETVAVKRHTSYGSANIQAVSVGAEVVFVQRNYSAVRAVQYDYERDGFTAPDLSLLAPQMLADYPLNMVYQRAPYTVLWLVTWQAKLVALTLDEGEGVRGWSRHPLATGAHVRAVASLPATGLIERDAIWAVIEDQAGRVAHLCRMRPLGIPASDWFAGNRRDADVLVRRQWRLEDPAPVGVVNGWLYRGRNTFLTSAHFLVWDSLGQLFTAEVDYSIDKISDTITRIVPEVGRVIGGFARFRYQSVMEPTAFVVPSEQGRGTGATTRTDEVDLYLLASRGGEVSVDGGESWEPLAGVEADVTGEVTVRQNSGYTREARLIVRTADIWPLHVAAVGVRVRRYD